MFRTVAIAAAAVAMASGASAQISEGFENGWDQTTWATYAPDCMQGGSVVLDSTTAHTGKNSIKVIGAGGYCGHAFVGTTAVPAGNFYVRAWMKTSVAFGSPHVSFIVMPDSSQGAGKHLRMGAMSNIMLYNREDNDATLPDLSPQGIATSQNLPSASWQCLEYHITSTGTIETWLNGAAIPGLTIQNGAGGDTQAGWTRTPYKPSISGVYFGWESYGGDANTIWYDDISISSTRVGCGAGSGSGSASSAPASSAKPTTLSTMSSAPAASSSAVKTTTAAAVTTAKPSTTSAAPPPVATTTAAAAGGSIGKYAQCGGIGWTGSGSCVSGTTCNKLNDYYSQCL